MVAHFRIDVVVSHILKFHYEKFVSIYFVVATDFCAFVHSVNMPLVRPIVTVYNLLTFPSWSKSKPLNS